MEKFVKAVSIVVIGSCLFASCSKTIEENKPKGVVVSIPPPTRVYYQYGIDILEDDFLKNSDDIADQKFNYVNHAMTLGLLEIYRNHPTILSELVKAVNLGTYKQTYLFDFADANPEVNAIFNEIFTNRFSDFTGSWKNYVQANYVYDTTYVPVVAFLNPSWANVNEEPYISEPLEINEEKFSAFKNDYPLWLRENNVELFSTVNNNSVAHITNPILAVRNDFVYTGNTHFLIPIDLVDNVGGSNSTPTDPTNPPPYQLTSCELNPLPSLHTHEDLVSVGVRINERYEGTGDTEFRLYYAKSLTYIPTSNSWQQYGPSSGYPIKREIELNLSKSQIGGSFAIPNTIFGPATYEHPSCFDIPKMTSLSEYKGFVIGCFEWDWGHSPKLLGKHWIPAYSAIGDMNGRRKYESEWYFFDPATNTGYDFGVRNPTPNTTNSFWTKGQLQLRRQNH